ncbi:diacylglycerol kinase catalytic subunit [Candidatus Magnetobacterium bavaricum]|uniref:Diacylglycerol kinase catalytic subunit n=1 Tax=Candidatus Magnetobacterium bavaricum TaxID=29290 RepID=A0A0F3GSF3_9BACT|nr:diacylglycerol kinase catalytic subunit [Candidatus Magnetobacterium bavaricum]
MRLSALLIINPISTTFKASKIETARAMLQAAGYDVDLYRTQRNGDARNRAKEAANKTADKAYSIVFACGGDGTVNEVANGLAFSSVPMAILPIGGSNVLSRELGSRGVVRRAIASAIDGRPRNVSLGRIRTPLETRYFTTMAGIGFDALTVYNLNKPLKRVIGVPAYVVSGIMCLLGYRTDDIILRIDGREFNGYSAIVSKASRYGGEFRIAPEADITRAELYIHVFQGRGRGALLRHTAGIIGGQSLKSLNGIVGRRCNNIRLTAQSHIQMDGDYFGKCTTNADIEIDVCKDALMLQF